MERNGLRNLFQVQTWQERMYIFNLEKDGKTVTRNPKPKTPQ